MSDIHSVATQRDKPVDYQFALIVVTSLFFIWGFITCLNDILIPHLKNSFSLSYFEAMLVQFCFFAAYFIISIPAGHLVRKLGYQASMVTGLVISAIGCCLFIPASVLHIYTLFLFALFVLASGITVLQVAANPYVNLLGPKKTAPSRLNLTQAFNTLGTTVAPILGGALILSHATSPAAELVSPSSSVQQPYLILGLLLFSVALILSRLRLPDLTEPATDNAVSTTELVRQNPLLAFGSVALFLYVGAEVAIGSLLVNYLTLPQVSSLTEQQAASYVAYYWGGAMVGRFIGSGLMQIFNPAKILLLNALAVMMLLISTSLSEGVFAFWGMLAIGLFNSVMFPTIFSLSLHGLGTSMSQASGLLCLTIVGGAFIPLIQGGLADTIGLQNSFFVPLLCYCVIGGFGWYCLRYKAAPDH